MKGNEIMNYEQFSPEAKQAIEHIRKFLFKNKNNIERNKTRELFFTYLVSNKCYIHLPQIVIQTALSFSVDYNEAKCVEEFCSSKHYWLD